MQQWLEEKRQPPGAIERFWRQVLVSAINEELPRMAASHGLQVFQLGFLQSSNAYEMGVPAVPLGELYGSDAWKKIGQVEIHLRSPVDQVRIENGRVLSIRVGGTDLQADAYVSALPFERAGSMLAGIEPRSEQLRALPHHRHPLCGSTAPSPTCRTPLCWTGPSSGCSTRAKVAISSWW